MKTGFYALWNEKELIIEMGIKPDKKGLPIFYVITETLEEIQVSIDNEIGIAMVINWLNHLNTGINCEFVDYGQFSYVIDQIFKIYSSRYGRLLHYDNTYLNQRKKELTVSDKTISTYAGIGKSTVNDLTRGLTKQPRYYTVCKIHTALKKIAEINGLWD